MSPVWPEDHVVTLRDEVALLEPVFVATGDPFFLVGALVRRFGPWPGERSPLVHGRGRRQVRLEPGRRQ